MENVIISIAGNNGLNEASLTTTGTLTENDGGIVLEFDETEVSGIAGTKTRIVMSACEVSLQRLGASDTFIHFQKHQPSITTYGDVECPFAFSVYTHDLQFDKQPGGGDLNIRYTMDINGESAENHVWVNYKLNH